MQKGKLLITGGTGFVGSSLAAYFSSHYDVFITSRKPDERIKALWRPLDVTDKEAVGLLFEKERPEIVIHCAGNKNVGFCEASPKEARLTNAIGTQNIAQACNKNRAKLIYISTDLVFPCENGNYKEDETPQSPLVYGQTKYEGEVLASREMDNLAICRSAGIYGKTSPLLKWLYSKVRGGENVECFTDVFNTPTLVENLGEMIQVIIERKLTGTFHTVGSERVNRFEFFKTFTDIFDLDNGKLIPMAAGNKKAEMHLRPDSSLNSEKTSKALGVSGYTVSEGFKKLKAIGFSP